MNSRLSQKLGQSSVSIHQRLDALFESTSKPRKHDDEIETGLFRGDGGRGNGAAVRRICVRDVLHKHNFTD